MCSGMAIGAGLIAAQPARAAITFNEVMYDAPGGNPDHRFFEFRSSTGGAESLAGLTLIAIEGDGTATEPMGVAGTIDFVLPLGNVSTGTNGLALLRDGATVLQPAPHPDTTIITNAYAYNENTSVTYLLVSGFTGTEAVSDIDTNNDGVAETTYWTSVLDAVGFRDASTDFLYGAQYGGLDYNEADAPYNATDIFGFLRDPEGNPHAFRVAGAAFEGPFTVNASGTLPLGYELTPGNANTPVPEPASLALLAAGGLLAMRRRARA